MYRYLDAALGGGSDLQIGGSSSIMGILNTIAGAFVIVGLATSFIFMAFALIQYILSMGDPKNLETAQRALTWSLVSFGITAAAGSISVILFRLMGIQ